MRFEDAYASLATLYRDAGARAIDAPELIGTIKASWPRFFALPSRYDVGGRPCALDPRDYHADRLNALLRESVPDTAALAEVRYHAQWLLFLASGDSSDLPTVSLIIPIFNRGWLVESLMANCLRQTYEKVEIVVVDDGSTDDTLDRLAAYSGRIKIVAQQNTGVSGARNAGIAAASGEFVHFMDSDNLLTPDHFWAKVEAFAKIPDATICYCDPIEVALCGARIPSKIGTKFGASKEELTPTADLLKYNVVVGYPFLVTACTMPRYELLARMPAFETDLPRHEDARLWFRLAVDRVKAIHVESELFYRIITQDGLNHGNRTDKASLPVVLLRQLNDLLRNPELWPFAVHFVSRREYASRFVEADSVLSIQLDTEFERLAGEIRRLPAAAATASSMVELLLVLSGFCDFQRTTAVHGTQRWEALLTGLAAAFPQSDAGSDIATSGNSADLTTASAALYQDFATRGVKALRAKGCHIGQAVETLAGRGDNRKIGRPLLAFVVPAIGEVAAAERTVRSLLSQPLSNLVSILVVDPDRSRKAFWHAISERLMVLHDGKGVAGAYAEALKTTNAKYVRFLRPGDQLSPFGIVRALARLVRKRRILMETSRSDRSGKHVSKSLPDVSRAWLPVEVFQRVGGIDAALGDEFEKRLALRLRASSRFKSMRIPQLTQPSPVASDATSEQIAVAAIGSLIECIQSRKLWEHIPGVLADLGRTPFWSGEGVTGSIVERAFALLRRQLSDLPDHPDADGAVLTAILGGIEAVGLPEGNEILLLRSKIAGVAERLNASAPRMSREAGNAPEAEFIDAGR